MINNDHNGRYLRRQQGHVRRSSPTKRSASKRRELDRITNMLTAVDALRRETEAQIAAQEKTEKELDEMYRSLEERERNLEKGQTIKRKVEEVEGYDGKRRDHAAYIHDEAAYRQRGVVHNRDGDAAAEYHRADFDNTAPTNNGVYSFRQPHKVGIGSGANAPEYRYGGVRVPVAERPVGDNGLDHNDHQHHNHPHFGGNGVAPPEHFYMNRDDGEGVFFRDRSNVAFFIPNNVYHLSPQRQQEDAAYPYTYTSHGLPMPHQKVHETPLQQQYLHRNNSLLLYAVDGGRTPVDDAQPHLPTNSLDNDINNNFMERTSPRHSGHNTNFHRPQLTYAHHDDDHNNNFYDKNHHISHNKKVPEPAQVLEKKHSSLRKEENFALGTPKNPVGGQYDRTSPPSFINAPAQLSTGAPQNTRAGKTPANHMAAAAATEAESNYPSNSRIHADAHAHEKIKIASPKTENRQAEKGERGRKQQQHYNHSSSSTRQSDSSSSSNKEEEDTVFVVEHVGSSIKPPRIKNKSSRVSPQQDSEKDVDGNNRNPFPPSHPFNQLLPRHIGASSSSPVAPLHVRPHSTTTPTTIMGVLGTPQKELTRRTKNDSSSFYLSTSATVNLSLLLARTQKENEKRASDQNGGKERSLASGATLSATDPKGNTEEGKRAEEKGKTKEESPQSIECRQFIETVWETLREALEQRSSNYFSSIRGEETKASTTSRSAVDLLMSASKDTSSSLPRHDTTKPPPPPPAKQHLLKHRDEHHLSEVICSDIPMTLQEMCDLIAKVGDVMTSMISHWAHKIPTEDDHEEKEKERERDEEGKRAEKQRDTAKKLGLNVKGTHRSTTDEWALAPSWLEAGYRLFLDVLRFEVGDSTTKERDKKGFTSDHDDVGGNGQRSNSREAATTCENQAGTRDATAVVFEKQINREPSDYDDDDIFAMSAIICKRDPSNGTVLESVTPVPFMAQLNDELAQMTRNENNVHNSRTNGDKTGGVFHTTMNEAKKEQQGFHKRVQIDLKLDIFLTKVRLSALRQLQSVSGALLQYITAVVRTSNNNQGTANVSSHARNPSKNDKMFDFETNRKKPFNYRYWYGEGYRDGEVDDLLLWNSSLSRASIKSDDADGAFGERVHSSGPPRFSYAFTISPFSIFECLEGIVPIIIVTAAFFGNRFGGSDGGRRTHLTPPSSIGDDQRLHHPFSKTTNKVLSVEKESDSRFFSSSVPDNSDASAMSLMDSIRKRNNASLSGQWVVSVDYAGEIENTPLRIGAALKAQETSLERPPNRHAPNPNVSGSHDKGEKPFARDTAIAHLLQALEAMDSQCAYATVDLVHVLDLLMSSAKATAGQSIAVGSGEPPAAYNKQNRTSVVISGDHSPIRNVSLALWADDCFIRLQTAHHPPIMQAIHHRRRTDNNVEERTDDDDRRHVVGVGRGGHAKERDKLQTRHSYSAYQLEASYIFIELSDLVVALMRRGEVEWGVHRVGLPVIAEPKPTGTRIPPDSEWLNAIRLTLS